MKLMFGQDFGGKKLTMADFEGDKYAYILGKNDFKLVRQLYGFHDAIESGVDWSRFTDELNKSVFKTGNGGSPIYPDELILDNFPGVIKDVKDKNIYSVRCQVPEDIARFYSPSVWIFEVRYYNGDVLKKDMEEMMKEERSLTQWYANWMRWPLWYRLWLWAIRDKVATHVVEQE